MKAEPALVLGTIALGLSFFSAVSPYTFFGGILLGITGIIIAIIGRRQGETARQRRIAIVGLIISIAALLVILLLVVISVNNVFLQRELLVGSQVDLATIPALELVSIIAESDVTSEQFNNFSVLVRLSPGSDPISLESVIIELIRLTQDSEYTFVGAECSFALLEPNTYCQKIITGDNDGVLEAGERFRLLLNVPIEQSLVIGEDLMFIFTLDGEQINEARTRMPDIVTSTTTKIWPTG